MITCPEGRSAARAPLQPGPHRPPPGRDHSPPGHVRARRCYRASLSIGNLSEDLTCGSRCEQGAPAPGRALLAAPSRRTVRIEHATEERERTPAATGSGSFSGVSIAARAGSRRRTPAGAVPRPRRAETRHRPGARPGGGGASVHQPAAGGQGLSGVPVNSRCSRASKKARSPVGTPTIRQAAFDDSGAAKAETRSTGGSCSSSASSRRTQPRTPAHHP